MTLARYTGPRRPWIGAIGWLAATGVKIRGRLIVGDSVTPAYQLRQDDALTSTWQSWEKAS